MAVEMKTLSEAEAVRSSLGGTPDPEVAALPKRRRFSATYKRGIVRAAAACKESGEIGELLRREGLYSSHLTHWRRAKTNAVCNRGGTAFDTKLPATGVSKLLTRSGWDRLDCG